MPAGFQQPPVLKLSPDYKVFVNGLSSLPVQSTGTEAQTPPLGRGSVHYRDMNSDIAGVNISMGIESSPGTASFTINVPRHQTDAQAYLRDGEVTIKPMMEVHVYLRGRFNNRDNQPQYYLAFWGVVSTVQEQYSDGMHSISVSCMDILHWWEITKVVTSPASPEAAKIEGQNVTGLSSIYTGCDAHTIIYDLGKVSMQNFMLPNTINVTDATDNGQAVEQFNREGRLIALYWRKRFKAIRSSMRLYGFAGFTKTCVKKSDSSSKGDVGTAKESGKEPDNRSATENVVAGDYVITTVMTCDNQIQAMKPYKTTAGRDAGQQESQQRSKLEIAKEVAQNTHWEFFLDMDGTIVFKPPFYNIDVRANEASVVRDIDVISYTRTETEAGAITSLYVKGRAAPETETDEKFGGWWIDWPLAMAIGLRHEQREEWRLTDSKLAKQYAQAELVKHNAMLDTLELTIPGRPELRLGYPIYVEPLDSFYYIYSIDHGIQAGGTFTTTLAMKSKRTRLRNAEGRVQRLLAAVQKKPPGQSGKVLQNQESCPPLSVNSAIPDVVARMLATSGTEVRSEKGKGLAPMSVGTQYNSEAAAEKRKAQEAEALLESDPCNEEYKEALLKRIEAANAKQEDVRLGRDGNAPGDWYFVENHPVLPKSAGANVLAPTDGSELVDEVQITDEQGYKLFGPFLYGRFVALSPSGRMELGTDGGGTRSNIASGSDAGGAGGSGDPTAILRYMIDPSVGAITLKLGSRVGQTGAGVGGEAFTATRMASEDASQPKGKGFAGLPYGKVSVDDINNCEKGSVAEKKGADTKESEAAYAQLRKCTGQGEDAESLEPAMVSEEDSKERLWEMSPSKFEEQVSKKSPVEQASLRKAYNHRAGDLAYQKVYEDKMSDRSKDRLAVLRERRELMQKQRQGGLTESESERLNDLEAERRSWSGANAKARFEGRL